MKKLFISFFLIAFCFSANGQSIKRTSGSLGFLKSEKVVGITFTYENMRVGKLTEEEYVRKKMGEYNEKRMGWGDEWKEAWIRDRAERYEPKFIELFSKYIGEKGISVDNTRADYEISVNADFIEPGFNVGVARRNASVNLTCRFVNKSDGNEVAVVTIVDASANNFGGGDFEVGFRVQESFAKAGREFAKFLIKEGKL
ncbi:MAG: hypothetical protein PHG58_08810 [Clostridia bacterium]|nr:hypothetical protein [Clostridia bacterium]